MIENKKNYTVYDNDEFYLLETTTIEELQSQLKEWKMIDKTIDQLYKYIENKRKIKYNSIDYVTVHKI